MGKGRVVGFTMGVRAKNSDEGLGKGMMAKSGCDGEGDHVLQHEDLAKGRVTRVATREGASKRGQGKGRVVGFNGGGVGGEGEGLGVDDGGEDRELQWWWVGGWL